MVQAPLTRTSKAQDIASAKSALAAQRKEFTINHSNGWMNGWMGGGMWLWWAIGVLVVVLLVIVIAKMSNKKS